MTVIKYITLPLLLVLVLLMPVTHATASPDITGAEFAAQCFDENPACHDLVDEMVAEMSDGIYYCAESPAVLLTTLEFIASASDAADISARNLLTFVILNMFPCQ